MYKIAGQNTIIKTADLKVLIKKEKGFTVCEKAAVMDNF